MTSGIYEFRNVVTGKAYIGSAVDLRTRRRHHVARLQAGNHRNRHLQNAWKKSGAQAFRYRVLLLCSKADLLFFEQRAINAVVNRVGRQHLYNLDLVAGSALGRRHSDATKEKIAAAHRGKKATTKYTRTPEQSAAISARMKGKPSLLVGRTVAAAVRAKIAATLKGHGHSPETRARISAAGIGRLASPETKLLLSAQRRGRRIGPMSSATKEKISAAKQGQRTGFLGRKHSAETKAKMRTAKAVAREQRVRAQEMLT